MSLTQKRRSSLGLRYLDDALLTMYIVHYPTSLRASYNIFEKRTSSKLAEVVGCQRRISSEHVSVTVSLTSNALIN